MFAKIIIIKKDTAKIVKKRNELASAPEAEDAEICEEGLEKLWLKDSTRWIDSILITGDSSSSSSTTTVVSWDDKRCETTNTRLLQNNINIEKF